MHDCHLGCDIDVFTFIQHKKGLREAVIDVPRIEGVLRLLPVLEQDVIIPSLVRPPGFAARCYLALKVLVGPGGIGNLDPVQIFLKVGAAFGWEI